MTSNLDRLATLRAVHLAAYGDTPHPILTLIDSAAASGSEAVAASVAEHVAASAPSESKGLAAVSRELDADRRPPSLWAIIDIENILRPTSGSVLQALQNGHGITTSWRFRREDPLHENGRPLAARILCPGGLPFELIEATAQSLRRANAHLTIMHAKDESRRALLAAAVERAGKKGGA
jgi:hypothetical protein